MNINPGGKNVPDMHDTIIPLDNPHGLGGQHQSFQYPDHLPAGDTRKEFEGKPKGIATILIERGMIRRNGKSGYETLDGRKVIGECPLCKQAKSRNPQKGALDNRGEREGDDSEDDEGSDVGDDMGPESDEDDRPTDCCLRRMLTMQQDFRNEKSMLFKVQYLTSIEYLTLTCGQIITGAGHKCIFLPKFHCELNPIEYYWAWVKRWFRSRCNGNFATSKKLFADALDACPGDVIRRFFRRSNRYASVYQLGATGLLAEYAVKRYKSHRAVGESDLVLAAEEKKEKDEKKKEKKQKNLKV
jgi:hypothetical protein